MAQFLLFLGVMFVLVLLGVPVACGIGIGAIVVMLSGAMSAVPLSIVAQRMYTGVDNFSLLAIPLFLIAGGLMERGGMSERIVKLMSLLFGRLRGGINYITIAACMFFAGLSGSAIADTVAVGSIMVPMYKKNNYSPEFAGSVLASSGIIGPIIPPSIPMVVYALTANVSIGALFLGGYLPGVLIGVGLAVVATLVGSKDQTGSVDPISMKEAWAILKDSLLTLGAPLVIIVGILAGWFTATESAAVAAVYSFVVGKFIYRELQWKDIPKIMIDSMLTSATVMLVVATSTYSSWVITAERLPQLLTAILSGVTSSRIVMLLIMNLVMLFWGMIMDITPSIMILTPIFMPICKAFGIDLVYFGVLMVVNLCIGYLTPPVGTVLYVTSGLCRVKAMDLFAKLLPMFIWLVIVLVLLILFPQLITWLPSLM